MLWMCCTQYVTKFGKIQQWPQDWKRSVFIPIPKKGNAKECSNYCTMALISVQFSSVAHLRQTLRDPMDCSTAGLPVHHQLPEFTQTKVHWVGDAILPSHPLSSPSPPAFNLSQDQGLFQWVSSSHQVGEVLEFQLQHQSSEKIITII